MTTGHCALFICHCEPKAWQSQESKTQKSKDQMTEQKWKNSRYKAEGWKLIATNLEFASAPCFINLHLPTIGSKVRKRDKKEVVRRCSEVHGDIERLSPLWTLSGRALLGLACCAKAVPRGKRTNPVSATMANNTTDNLILLIMTLAPFYWQGASYTKLTGQLQKRPYSGPSGGDSRDASCEGHRRQQDYCVYWYMSPLPP
jgi:hypothetical protein